MTYLEKFKLAPGNCLTINFWVGIIYHFVAVKNENNQIVKYHHLHMYDTFCSGFKFWAGPFGAWGEAKLQENYFFGGEGGSIDPKDPSR